MGWYEPYAAAGMFAYQNPGLAAAIGAGYAGYKTYRFVKKNKQSLKRGALIAGAAYLGSKMVAKTRSKARISTYNKYSPMNKVRVVGRVQPRQRTFSTQTSGSARARATGRWKVQPMTRPARKFRGGGGKFGGPFGGGRRKRYRMKKLKMKKMKSVYRDCFFKGGVIHQEYGQLVTNDYCCAIGHTTPIGALRLAFWIALVKKVIDKLGIQSINPAEPTFGITAGDIVALGWRNESGPNNAPVSTGITCTDIESIQSMATRLSIEFNTAGVAANDEIMLESISYEPQGLSDSTRVQINLQGADVRFYYSGELKMQNRTQDSATNTEADDLVAQHVVGKSYSGYKNYAELSSRNANGNAGFCGNYNGSLLPTSANGGNDFREPLPSVSIKGCSSVGVRMQPAELKISKISYKKGCGMLKFVREVAIRYDAGQATAAGNFKTYFGNYKFYMLEKEIEINSAPTTPVTIGCEWQYKVGVVIDVKRNTFMQRVVVNNSAI